MSHTLTVNTARSNVNTALVASVAQPYTPKAFPSLTFGETQSVTLYLIDDANSYDERSGTTGYTPRISVMLPTLQPTGGTFTISEDTDEYIVSGAGSEEANGLYVGATAVNGKVAYELFSDDTVIYSLTWNGTDAWEITKTDTSDIIYNNSDAGSTPPMAGWLVGTVTSDEDEYTVSGAGLDDVNGVYIRDGDEGGKARYTLEGGITGLDSLEYRTVDSKWAIYSSVDTPSLKYISAATSVDTPDLATFETIGGGAAGPAPIVTQTQLPRPELSPAPIVTEAVETITADYNASASEIESALNAMNDGAGPFGDSVAVDKFADGSFSILFDSVGEQNPLIVSAAGIQPNSAASVLPLIEGDATTRDGQLVRILAEPLVFEDSAVQVENGWSITINANNANILRALAAEQGDMSANFSIDVVSPTATVDVVARGPVILKQ